MSSGSRSRPTPSRFPATGEDPSFAKLVCNLSGRLTGPVVGGFMSVVRDGDTELLLQRAGRGDPSARAQLLDRYRGRLRQVVACRLDRRLAARVDPSDVVQEALADADRKLGGFLRDRPLPFYPWL